MSYRSKSDYYNVNVCLVTGQYSWFSDHTNGTWSSSAVPLVHVPDTKDYKWIDQNSGMTWSGNDTHLYSCPNRTEGILYQIFRNLFCSSSLTEARGNWRCVAVNRANDRGQEGYQASTQRGMGSTLSLSINNSGLFILCGNKLYKEFPPKWAGRCGLGYLAPSVTKYSALNASQITNLGSFIHKVAPRSRIQRDAIGIPPTYRKTSLASIISSLGAEQQKKAIQGISEIMEKELMATRQILEACQSGVNWDSVLQSPSYLERQATEQRSCAVVGKQCCLYVNKSGIVHAKINRLRELAKQPKSFAWISGMGDWLSENWSYVLVFGFFGFLFLVFICGGVSRYRSLTSQHLTPVVSPQQLTRLIVSEASCQLSNGKEGTDPTSMP
ncbi:endogenous retroviral envelope protein HEMO [Talpa occidentalis]|uniref:endogenous retroviral envelope protein HEMO-like n=1 Tax=Talpa occidentalis TaxID=50954 RepID=UPI00188FC3AA|nr:endogenous retroviral envelope protein HEMO-like [Talpa occidentalis]XP_037380270.1 endogenous retroviral envelope protein HEMO-like [Talpa occidentalis]XP_037385171.1 endogenous retroviral envelope protein HEMO [Talpa occidentalis]XP_037385172.1 endogenous retroviral envelope protein HEMO [Talpa occidentalis]